MSLREKLDASHIDLMNKIFTTYIERDDWKEHELGFKKLMDFLIIENNVGFVGGRNMTFNTAAETEKILRSLYHHSTNDDICFVEPENSNPYVLFINKERKSPIFRERYTTHDDVDRFIEAAKNWTKKMDKLADSLEGFFD